MHPTLHLVVAAVVTTAGACSLVTVQQDTFTPLEIQADRPPPPPPRVVLTKSSIKIKEKVQFELGSAVLLPASHSLLDEVAQVFLDNEQIKSVQVEGHTDTTGGIDRNRQLSRQRAQSVRKYLISKGVAGDRLVAKGFGPDRPIADNESDEGREANRRVEFNILEQGPKKTLVQDE